MPRNENFSLQIPTRDFQRPEEESKLVKFCIKDSGRAITMCLWRCNKEGIEQELRVFNFPFH